VDRCSEEGFVGSCRGKEEAEDRTVGRIGLLGLAVERKWQRIGLLGVAVERKRKEVMVEYSCGGR